MNFPDFQNILAVSNPFKNRVTSENTIRTTTYQITLVVCRALFCLADAINRIRSSTTGVNKALKLGTTLTAAATLSPGPYGKTCELLYTQLTSVTRNIENVTEYCKWPGVTRPRWSGKRGAIYNGPLKSIQTAARKVGRSLLFWLPWPSVGKSLLVLLPRWSVELPYVSLDPKAYASQLQAMLTGLGHRCPLFTALMNGGITRVGLNCLFIARVSSFMRNVLGAVDWGGSKHENHRSLVGCVRDTGKLALFFMPHSVTWSWVLISLAVAISALAMVVMDSYELDNQRGKPFTYPEWMKA